ncbi:hypothetical protein EV714DRAFT_271590 [Schizophyllum commune]
MLTPLVAILREPGRRCDDEDNSELHGALDGVLNGTRWKATDDLEPSQFTLYDVASDTVSRIDKDSEQNTPRKLLNGKGHVQLCEPLLSSAHPSSTTAEQLPGKHLLAVWVGVRKGMEGAFVDWYEGEHMPMLKEVPGWLCGRLYSIVDDRSQGERPTESQDVQFLAVHRFSKEGFMDSKELKASQNTPWLTKVMEYITSKDLRLFELDVLYEGVGCQ